MNPKMKFTVNHFRWPFAFSSPHRLLIIISSLFLLTNGQQHQVPVLGSRQIATVSPQIISDEFSPLVTARCDRGIMYITIVTQQPFYGVAHTRDQRKATCMTVGDGSHNTTLKISLLAQPDDELYCGVQRYKGERTVLLAVRMHRSLELSEDRFFHLTCHSGYKNVRGYKVNLKLVDNNGQRATRLIHGLPYSLRAELSPKDSITTLRMKNCFVFAKSSAHVELVDRSGCPAVSGLITGFHYNDSSSGEAFIPEMFKFPDEAKVHFQCDALLCRDDCDEPDCEGTSKAREYELDGYSQVSASTSVFIREPSDSDELIGEDGLGECTEWRFPWLITLCICLAIMLLVMLLLNLFMCSSLTCRCAKTEVNEKEPTSDIEDFDPYRADWTAPNSLHGSRYSLENARQNHAAGYHTDETFRSDTPGPEYDNENYIPDRQHSTRQYPAYESDDSIDRRQRKPVAKNNNSLHRPTKAKEIDYYDGPNVAHHTDAKRY